MAVKFSEFSAKQLVSDVTEVVGYLQTGELNVRIPPANLDTTYAVSTGNAGASPTISLQGTKPNQPAINPSTVSLTGSGATLLAGNGSTTIDFASTSYAITSTDTSPAGTVPLVLTGTGGGDAGTDTVNLVGAGGIGVTSSSNTVTITSTASNTTYSLDVPSATTNINLAGSDGSNDAITLVGGTEIQLVRDSASQITINSQAASYSSWTVAGDTGNTVVNSGETATIAGGTGITTAESGRAVTISIADAGISTAKIADDAVTADKLANSINTEITANTAKVTNATHTGDVTGATALTIGNDKVITAKILNDNVTTAKLEARYKSLVPISTLAGTVAFDCSAGSSFKLSGDLTGAYTINLSSYKKGQVITIFPLKAQSITLAGQGSSSNTFNKIGGIDYDNTTHNILQIECVDDSATDPIFFYSIATFASDSTP